MPYLSSPLEELPTFLATITMVSDDETEIVKKLTQAERKSPPRYDPARQIFLRILAGDLTYDFGVAQALKLFDPVERDCAVSVLRAASSFLRGQSAARIESLPALAIALPNGLELRVGPLWVRHSEGVRLLVLHFWQTALTARQFSAAAAILRSALVTHMPHYAEADIDFVSIAVPERAETRKLQNLSWSQLAPLNESELLRFSEQLATAWVAYQRIGPRRIKRRSSQAGLFD